MPKKKKPESPPVETETETAATDAPVETAPCDHARSHVVAPGVLRCPDCRRRTATDAQEITPTPLPPGHLERCENQVLACERLVRRAKGGWAKREAEWKLKHAKRRLANAKTLKPRPG